MEKHKAPAQLPTNEPSLELQIFKKSIGGTLGGAIGPVVVFPFYYPPLGWGPRKDFSLGDSVRSPTGHSVLGGHGGGYIYTYTTTLRVIRRLGEGGKDPKRVRITKRKTMQKTPRQIVLKSNRSMESNVFVVAICVNQFGIVNAWACVCMCIYVRMVILSSRYCFPHAPR